MEPDLKTIPPEQRERVLSRLWEQREEAWEAFAEDVINNREEIAHEGRE